MDEKYKKAIEVLMDKNGFVWSEEDEEWLTEDEYIFKLNKSK